MDITNFIVISSTKINVIVLLLIAEMMSLAVPITGCRVQ